MKIIIKLLWITLFILIGVILFIKFTNRTFLKDYYEITNPSSEKIKIPLPLFSYFEKETGTYSATFLTIRSVKSISSILNNYVENLQACYDESYFYDKDLDITISKYYIEDRFPFNKIYLTYEFGNYCEDEYVLDDNWITDFKENANIQQTEVYKCDVTDNNIDCNSKQIDVSEEDINDIIEYISEDGVTRIENKINITVDETVSHYLIKVYYYLNDNYYILNIFKYNDYLAFKVTDINDHPKNAIYDIDEDIDSIFTDVYNNY